MEPYILIAAIVILILAVFAIHALRISWESGPERPDGEGESELGDVLSESNKRIMLSAVLALTVAVVVGTIVMTGGSGRGTGETSDSGSSFVPFLPIWIAIFVPIIVNRRRSRIGDEKASEERRVILIVLGLLCLIGVAVAFFLMNR